MTKQYFKATHSSGAVHLRTSNGAHDYKFAIVTANTNRAVGFSSRRDLAQAEAERQRQWLSGVEVVPAVEIDKAEYNQLLKAGKRAYVATFCGKKFTRTTSIDAKPLTHAVAFFKAAFGDKPSFVSFYFSQERADEAIATYHGHGYTTETVAL